MSYIMRFLSAILAIFIVIPLYFVLLVVGATFQIFNGFTYENFVNYDFDYVKLQEYGVPFKYFGLIKIWMIVTTPIMMIFVNFYNGTKDIKF